ncbi:MAG: glycosyltransferase [Aphanizomenon gracile PMC627.10]|nr:glycosyltransferase [Aphanizomenon gracile PMC627.10]
MNKYNILYITPSYGSSVPDYENARFICNNPPEEAVNSGKAIALPRGEFDVMELLSQMPSNWKPDILCISSAISLLKDTPVPRKLHKLDCPSIMKLADSHHNLCQPTFQPIRRLIEYANLVKCQYNYTTYNRQHIHFYREAGLPNVFWVPGSICIKPYSVSNNNIRLSYDQDLIFCGNIETHPYRKKLINFLQDSGVNISISKCSYTQSLEKYSRAKITFNCSMNGDFNRRIFEVLMAGGFLITDRLTTESGLPLLFKEGLHLECYGSKYELIDKLKYYLKNLDKVTAIAKHGNQEFLTKYHPDVMKKSLYNYALQLQEIPDLFLVPNTLESSKQFNFINSNPMQKTQANVHIQQLSNRIKFYELIQEIHYINSSEINILIVSDQEFNSRLSQDLQDLPRLNIKNISHPLDIKELDSHIDIIVLGEILDLDEQFKEIPDVLNKLFTIIPNNGLIINFHAIMNIHLQKSRFIQLYSDNLLHCSFYFKYSTSWKIKDSDLKLPYNLLRKAIFYRALDKAMRVINKVIVKR